MFIQWNEDLYALGIDEIDRQHQMLFLVTNQLAEAQQAPLTQRPTDLAHAFKQLLAYTKYHFSSEEALLREHGWPQLQAHQVEHRLFTDTIADWIQRFHEKPALDVRPLLDYLVKWIIEHIRENDKKYATELLAQGVALVLTPKRTPDGQHAQLWNEKALGLRIAQIDHQHRELVGLLQQANDLQHANASRRHTFLPGIIERLFHYTEYHFSSEEELMAKKGWPGLHEHRQLHAGFVHTLEKIDRDLGHNEELANDEAIVFLKNWTLHHILEKDREFKTWLERLA